MIVKIDSKNIFKIEVIPDGHEINGVMFNFLVCDEDGKPKVIRSNNFDHIEVGSAWL